MKLFLIRFLLVISTLGLFILTPSPTFMKSIPEETGIEENSSEKNIHIIIDLGGVCIDTDNFKTLSMLGLLDIATHIFWNFKNPSKIKKILYRALNQIQPTGNETMTLDHEGDLLPGIMCDWMTNKKSNEAIRKLVLPSIISHPEWFSNNTEQKLIYKLSQMMFTPDYFIHTRILILKTKQFIEKCKQCGYRISILSNWDSESFELLKIKFSDFFNMFDEIRISGNSTHLKPSLDPYEWFIEKYPEDTFVYIDDQEENIIAAQKVGMLGIHFTGKNNQLTLQNLSQLLIASDNIKI